MDVLLDIITSPAVLTGLLTVVTAVVPMIGLPAWAAALIGTTATVAVKAVEQTANGADGAEKKRQAVALVKDQLPTIVKALPRTALKIDAAIESAVHELTLDTVAAQPEPPKRTRKKRVDKPAAVE